MPLTFEALRDVLEQHAGPLTFDIDTSFEAEIRLKIDGYELWLQDDGCWVAE